MLDSFSSELTLLNHAGLLRKPKVISALKGARVKISGKWVVSFCSNDYLGLAQHPAVKKSMIRAVKKFGSGAGAARLLSGTTALHQKLEESIARFKRCDDAILFTSGYTANLGVITALIRKEDALFCDELNHASLVDAARLTKARLHIYKHRDMAHLESLLRKSAVRRQKSSLYVISDAIFSMDGDGAPLKDLVRLAKKYRAYTIIDEAHGTGVFGRISAGGWCEEQGLEKQVDVIIGTASKALGSVGGFAASSQTLIDYIRNKSRPFIFTTALPPGSCAATITALKILKSRPELRRRLWTNVSYIKKLLKKIGLNLRGSIAPIIPIMIGDTQKTAAISQALWKKGFYAPAIRPPTVPQGQSRLRLTITTMHTKTQINGLIKALKALI
jgi:8-amino-7-oxononanoate synthase